jgi:ABC-2 type transport system ATP-binding protein
MTTHDILRARIIADRVGIMKQSRLVAIRKREEFRYADLEAIYIHQMEAAEAGA